VPELPEVETVRRGLEHHLLGYTVKKIQILDSRAVRRNMSGIEGFRKGLVGEKFDHFNRRGKFLWIPISNSMCLVAHLGMSGQILVRIPDYPPDQCERVKFWVERSGQILEVRFADQRLFGGLYLDRLVQNAREESIPESTCHIAMDPLEPSFEVESVALEVSKRKAGIKSLLLNQEIVSGIGNIYADETLWLAKVHYLTPGSSLSRKEIARILRMAQKVLAKAVQQGGTSFDELYKNVNGKSGYFAQSLNAYGQTGEACKRCSTTIVRVAWSNRGSHFCPKCQKPWGRS
jgi:formamidopyrimidine-DNA glycosylase